ncbi:MAG TPA: DAK2 domain-containing protein, partial [Ornithinicoccus sp.]|nr:DAK2 domain-containing protein [Ornithinicoccus sp.]
MSAPTEVPLDLASARRWALAARAGLADARDQIDALNVFPVPDGDTGTNMFLTFDGALDVLRGHHDIDGGAISLTDGLALLARGMLLSARGNSGVILSQLARGLHEAA